MTLKKYNVDEFPWERRSGFSKRALADHGYMRHRRCPPRWAHLKRPSFSSRAQIDYHPSTSSDLSYMYHQGGNANALSLVENARSHRTIQ